MSKKDKQNAQPDVPEQETQAAAAAEEKELPPEDKKAEEAQPETFTVTREQMEKMEGLAKSLAEEHDKYLRLAAEYDNYRKRTAKESTPTRRSTPFRACFRCMTISNAALLSSRTRAMIPIRRGSR